MTRRILPYAQIVVKWDRIEYNHVRAEGESWAACTVNRTSGHNDILSARGRGCSAYVGVSVGSCWLAVAHYRYPSVLLDPAGPDIGSKLEG